MLKKTYFIYFNLRNPYDDLSSLFIGGSKINSCQRTSFLGLIVGHYLNLSDHTDNLSRKITSGIFILRKLPRFNDSSVLLTANCGCL